MLTLRNLLTASAIAACATTAYAQTPAPAAPMMDASGQQVVMIPIPGTDNSMMNRFDDPLVQARVARSGGDASSKNMKMNPKQTVDEKDKGK
ncbi:hypothetical protein QN360_10480 [Glaciimonas sp. CA11.2]|uniref:hypothetical protein n=1 Tax=Glaciimonas sp. CA11.2 TaxID=3048601 RepID=UPI002AB57B50|nr:hypothetical protein [Glaciimonas sp. CA11.2]MDY7546971.1 hypothetical protein [Glaciimonas sp. CA11.2]MEB0163331.1 hypothetical protein [Glaciimonas sp. CA11.2]